LPIAYFTTLFPKLSESFVLNEVVQLRRRGLDIRVVSFDASRRLERKRHDIAAELGDVEYTVDGRPWRHLRALCYWLVRRPLGVCRLVLANWRRPVIRGDGRVARFANALVAARAVKTWGASHIHSHWSYPTDVAALVQHLVRTTRSATLHAHDIFEDLQLYAEASHPVAERVRDLDFVITCTKHNQDIVREQLPAALHDAVHFSYHGLDTSQFVPREQPADGEAFVIATVGRMVPYKGFDRIVQAVAIVRERGLDVRALIAGSHGSLTPVVHDLIEKLDLAGAVTVLGEVTQAEVVDLLAQSHVFVNHSDPNGEYGVANVIVEAMSSGLPVIVTRRPHVNEYVVDGENGLVVEFGDVDALADAIMRLAGDPELRRRLGAAARRTAVDAFDISQTVQPLHDLLRARAHAGG
jgi:colanic acid/amylovoran biosynthesis glycosyltransferase